MTNARSGWRIFSTWLACALALLVSGRAHADSVAQISTGVRISRSTAVLLDPQGRPGGSTAGTDTAVKVGDVLTFVVHFTPVPNGGVRGLGGYVTVYIPRNTEVVGARVVDASGNTVAPHRGGFAADGAGPRGANTFTPPLVGGSLSQLYADTGIFYSTDARTVRVPDGSQAGETFVTLDNGILMNPKPTAANGLQNILGAANPYAHNQWDYIQALAFGVGSAALNGSGQGQTADMYGSPVAGPDTWYPYEASYGGDLSMPLVAASVVATDTTGPWLRVQTYGAEIGRRGNVPPMPDPGDATRIGVPAVDNAGELLGARLDTAHALPAYDSASPGDPYTRAVRFAVGELLVGQEYLSEISLRVLAVPLDPVAGADVVCAEVFGGDASSEVTDGTKDGKDNSWRYFLPAPACVSLNLLFDLDVSRLAALAGDPLQYELHAKNLSVTSHENVVVRHCYSGGELTFVAAAGGGVDRAATGCPASYDREVAWTIADWLPGAELDYTIDFTVKGGTQTIGHAVFTSDQLPAPGFSTVAFTVIDSVSIVDTALVAAPTYLATKSGAVGYELTISNSGTGAATLQQILVTLPTGFSYTAGSATLDGATIADPAVNGDVLTFSAGLGSLAAGAAAKLGFEVSVSGTAQTGVNTLGVDVWLTDPFKGETVNDSRTGLGEVLVGVQRSEVPAITGVLAAGDTKVSGTTSEATGTTIRVYVGGVEAAETLSVAGGKWSATLAPLFGGQRVSASAEAAGELESLRSAEVSVLSTSGATACGDGDDNDGDGKIDFPADPDCTSAADPDETHTPQCADGKDNDGDGKIDFGADVGCASLLDDAEAGAAQCADGKDNDGDGDVDYPDDRGCESDDDVSEVDVPQCADGKDNDSDGKTDFPADGDCAAATDDRESAVDAPEDAGTSTTDAGAGDGSVDDVDASAMGSDGGPSELVDLGGVKAPSSGGCGCSTLGARAPSGPLGMSGLLLLAWLARRQGARVRRRAAR